MSTALAESMVALLFAEQEGFWPVAKLAEIQRPKWITSPGELVGQLGSVDYVAPFAFTERTRQRAFVANPVNLCRVDIDPPKGIAIDEQRQIVADRVALVTAVVAEPSWIVDSGRGAWCWFKLEDWISVGEVQRLAKLLALISGSEDVSSWGCEMYARLPGCVNEKTGLTSFVSAFSGHRFDSAWLINRIDGAAEKMGISSSDSERSLLPSVSGNPVVVNAAPALTLADLPVPQLRKEMWEYIAKRPGKIDCESQFARSRSQIEQSIFVSLIRQGWSDDAIHAFAYQKGFARYCELEGVTDYGDRSIRNAREYIATNAWEDRPARNVSLYKANETYDLDRCTERDQEATKPTYSKRDPYKRWRLLKLLAGRTTTEACNLAREKFGDSRATTMRNLKWLEDTDLINRNGRSQPITLTAKGSEIAAQRLCPHWVAMGNPSRATREKRLQAARDRERKPTRSPKHKPDSHPPRVGASSSPLTRARAQVKQLKRTVYDGRYRIGFEGRQKTFHLVLITPIEETPFPLLHEQLQVGWTNGEMPVPVFANFIPPAPSDTTKPDPLESRFHLYPTCHGIAVGALVTPTGDGFELQHRDDPDENGELLPKVGLVVQSPTNFWAPLLDAVPDPYGRILRVHRTGSKQNRAFNFDDQGPAPSNLDIPKHVQIDLPAYIWEIASTERLHNLIDPLPDWWQFW